MSARSYGSQIINKAESAFGSRTGNRRRAVGVVSRYVSFGAVGLLLSGAAASAFAQNRNPKEDLKQKITAQFTLTTLTADRSDIVNPGAIVVLQKDGLTMCSTVAKIPLESTYKDGKFSMSIVSQMKWAALALPPGMNVHDIPQRKFVTGEKFWIYGVVVQNDGVNLFFYSDPYDNVRYYSQVKVPFDKKNQYPAADALLKTISEVVTAQAPDNTAASGQQQAPAASAPPEAAPARAQAAAPAPMPAIAPPPPPTDQAPPTIKLGDKKDQVIANFGQPQKVVDLGTKEIDFYPDMKVTFVKGKVTDVQ